MFNGNTTQCSVPTITIVDKRKLPTTVETVDEGIYMDTDGRIYGVVEEMSLNGTISTIALPSGNSITVNRAYTDVWDHDEQPKQSEDSVCPNVADKLDELITKYKHLKADTPLNEDWKLKTNTYSEIIKDLIEWRSQVM